MLVLVELEVDDDAVLLEPLLHQAVHLSLAFVGLVEHLLQGNRGTHDRLVPKQLVESWGWYLPHNRIEFVKRGQEHHNCVASYKYKHVMTSGEPHENRIRYATRLMFHPRATAELDFILRGNQILQVHLRQCKGMRNKAVQFEELSAGGKTWSECMNELLMVPAAALEVVEEEMSESEVTALL